MVSVAAHCPSQTSLSGGSTTLSFVDGYIRGLFPGLEAPEQPLDLRFLNTTGNAFQDSAFTDMDQCTSLDSLAAFTKQFFEDNGFLPGLKTLSRTLENSRAYVIQRFGLEDSSLWHLIERCARIASALFGAPILVTLIDVDTQLVLAAVDRPYKPKDVLIYNESLCSHTALRTDGSVLEILDTQKDWRFKNIPNAPRAYLGQPLMLPLHDGGPSVPFGSLCILGDTPRIPMTSEERGALSDLADLLSADIQRAWQENRQRKEVSMRNFISDLISNLSAYHSTISPPPTTDSFPLESAHPKSIKQENNFDILAATGDVRSMLDSDFTCLVDLSTLHLSWIVETSPAATDSTDRRTISRSKYGWVSHGKQGSSFPSGQDRREQGLPAPGLRIIDYSCSENCRNYSPEAVFSSPGAINALVTFLHAYTDSSNSGFAHSGSDGALQCLLPPDSQSHIAIPLFSDEQPAVLLLVSTNRPFRVYEPADVSFASTFGVLCLGSLVKIKLIKADAAKTAFIATVSHELRTPLHGLLSQLELIREFAPKEFLAETEPFLQTAEVCGFSLRDVLNDVLDFGKQEHPNEEFQAGQCTETDISVVATEVLSVAYGRRRQWQTANVEVGELESSVDVYISIEDSPSGWLARTDVGGLRRVLLNLASNALKYTPAGSIVLSLRELETPVAPDTQEGRRLIEFSVADTGIGMSNEYKEDIFTPFSQENAFNPGSGLGMSISESILKRMGGEIRVSSEVGKGTTVSFTLLLDFVHPRPARTAADSARTIMKTLISQDENTMLSIPRPRTSESSPPSSHNITLPGPRHDSPRPDSPKSLSTIQGIEGNDHNSEDVRVLVVDDNKIGRKILTTLLARKGVPFREASDGLEALAVYRDFLPHLVWTDVSMPVMDGITSAKYMRAIEKELQLRPARICAITGMSSGDDMKQGLLGEAALDEWLVKGQTNLKTLTLGLEKMQRACRQRPASSTAVL